jgi:O-antigen ligase
MNGDISSWPMDRVVVAFLATAGLFGVLFFVGWFLFIGWDMWQARRSFRMEKYDGPCRD